MARSFQSLSGRCGGGRLNVANPGARPAMDARRDNAALRVVLCLCLLLGAFLVLIPETANRLDA